MSAFWPGLSCAWERGGRSARKLRTMQRSFNWLTMSLPRGAPPLCQPTAMSPVASGVGRAARRRRQNELQWVVVRAGPGCRGPVLLGARAGGAVADGPSVRPGGRRARCKRVCAGGRCTRAAHWCVRGASVASELAVGAGQELLPLGFVLADEQHERCLGAAAEHGPLPLERVKRRKWPPSRATGPGEGRRDRRRQAASESTSRAIGSRTNVASTRSWSSSPAMCP